MRVPEVWHDDMTEIPAVSHRNQEHTYKSIIRATYRNVAGSARQGPELWAASTLGASRIEVFASDLMLPPAPLPAAEQEA